MVHDAVKRGFSLLFPTASLRKLPRCSVDPFGTIDQGSIDETGRLVEKSRLVHNMSLKVPIGLSVNSRVIELFLPVCLFVFAL
jgi:hypothetical protein